MSLQFVVPQFIDVEDKIIGPISVRQFVIFMGGGALLVLSYQIVYRASGNFILFFLFAIFIIGATFVFAFLKINGQPFHFFLLNFFVNLRYPRLRVWNKSQEGLSSIRKKEKVKHLPPMIIKAPLTPTKLTQLSLVVDTGGAYHEEDNVAFDLDSINRRESLFAPRSQ